MSGQLTREEIEASSNDINRPLTLNKKVLDIKSEKKVQKYIPFSKRQDRPNAALWLIRNYPQLSDGQIGKLVGSTKNTVTLIKNNKYWNSSNLVQKDPVVSNLCSQNDITKAAEKKKAGAAPPWMETMTLPCRRCSDRSPDEEEVWKPLVSFTW